MMMEMRMIDEDKEEEEKEEEDDDDDLYVRTAGYSDVENCSVSEDFPTPGLPSMRTLKGGPAAGPGDSGPQELPPPLPWDKEHCEEALESSVFSNGFLCGFFSDVVRLRGLGLMLRCAMAWCGAGPHAM
nr:hypothetical protein BaRGS_028408 [Batillaria attramentaria]